MENSNHSISVTAPPTSTMAAMARIIQACQSFLSNENTKDFDTGLCLGIITGVEDNARYDKKSVFQQKLLCVKK